MGMPVQNCSDAATAQTEREFRQNVMTLPGETTDMSVTIPVVSTPNVLDGKPRIEETRVGVYQVGSLVREHNWSTAAVAEEFNLTGDEIDAALEYYESNPDEMEAIAEEETETRERLEDLSRAPR